MKAVKKMFKKEKVVKIVQVDDMYGVIDRKSGSYSLAKS